MKINFYFLILTLIFTTNESSLTAQNLTLGTGYYPYQRLPSKSLVENFPNIDSIALESFKGSYDKVINVSNIKIKKGMRIEDSGRTANKKIKLNKQDILSAVSIDDKNISITAFALFSDYELQKKIDPNDNLKPFLCKIKEEGKVLSVQKVNDGITSIIYQSNSLKLVPNALNEDKFCNAMISMFLDKKYLSEVLIGKTTTSKMGIDIWGTGLRGYIAK